eukprot:TRINITY_DN2847_c0_g2_i11.p1 TRINITY_DN2847_c0_g2~~TRINITY_DN2847_c0_g2_i11.p1  ORF type:complete len:704 (+),score=129.99 TRINITY_DN2847_c0_g2_i11:44-2155(+)
MAISVTTAQKFLDHNDDEAEPCSQKELRRSEGDTPAVEGKTSGPTLLQTRVASVRCFSKPQLQDSLAEKEKEQEKEKETETESQKEEAARKEKEKEKRKDKEKGKETEKEKENGKEKVSGVGFIRHGFFTTRSFLKPYFWIPEAVPLEDSSTQIFQEALRMWKLRKPDLVLTFKSGFKHPKFLFTTKCIGKLKDQKSSLFKLKEMFMGSDKKTQNDSQSLQGDDSTDKEHANKLEERLKQATDGINRLLYKQMKDLLLMMLQTAQRANCWIVVKGGSTGAMVLLEEVVAEIHPPPVVLVVDSPNQVRYTAKGIHKKKNATDQRTEEVKKALLKAEGESQKMKQKLIDGSVPLDRPPKRVDLTMDFWNEYPDYTSDKGWECETSADEGAEMVRWNQWVFRGGTHYILTESERFWDLNLEDLVLHGSLFIGGGKNTKDTLLSGLKSGSPLILVKHTGGIAQEFIDQHKWFEDNLDYILEDTPVEGKKLKRSSATVCSRTPATSTASDSAMTRTFSIDNRPGRSSRTLLLEGAKVTRCGTRAAVMPEHLAENKEKSKGLGSHLHDYLQENYFDRIDEHHRLELELQDYTDIYLEYVRKFRNIFRVCCVLDPLAWSLGVDKSMENEIALCLSNAALRPSSGSSDQLNNECKGLRNEMVSVITLLTLAQKSSIDAFMFGGQQCARCFQNEIPSFLHACWPCLTIKRQV